MCGIIGYCGVGPAFPYLFEGLKKLEYRGYDSAGVEVGGRVVKRAGSVDGLKNAETAGLAGRCGIGHTRWATHGAPSAVNAHPQSSGPVHLVHNGILENYAELRAELSGRYPFVSDTDTESAAHCIRAGIDGGESLLAATWRAADRLQGSFAFLVTSDLEPETICGIRRNSPLVVGMGERGVFLASDIAAIAEHCEEIFCLDNEESVLVRPDGPRFFGPDRREIRKASIRFDKNYEKVGFEGYSCFMEKEIHEVGEGFLQTCLGLKNQMKGMPSELFRPKRLLFCGCGTAYHACRLGKKLMERLVRIPCEAVLASEADEEDLPVDGETLCVFVSQSGETADTISALRVCKKLGGRTLAVTNVVQSSLEDLADFTLKTHAGREFAVASTKAYVAQSGFFYLLAEKLAGGLPVPMDLEELKAGVEACVDLPEIRALAGEMKGESYAFFLGRGLDHLTAMEASLKCKEITYIHSEAYAAGELKHGTLALIEPGSRVILFVTQRKWKEKMMNTLSEVRARGARTVLLSPFSDLEDCGADRFIRLPAFPDLYMPLISIVPCQSLAFRLSRERGIDCDKPRNLAKSVTVE